MNITYSIRSHLITSLNDLSTIRQYRTAIPEDAKQRICQKIDQSILSLVDLSPFESTASTDSDDSAMFEATILGQLTAKLSRAQRSKTVTHLIDLRDALLFDHLVTDETKHDLVKESKRIINLLLDLSDKEQNGKSNKEKNDDGPPAKKQKGKATFEL